MRRTEAYVSYIQEQLSNNCPRRCRRSKVLVPISTPSTKNVCKFETNVNLTMESSDTPKPVTPNSFDFIPLVECGKPVNGVITLQVTNIKTLWKEEANIKTLCNDILFQITHRRIHRRIQTHNIARRSVSIDGIIHLKVAASLHSFILQFRLRTWNVKRACWMSPATAYKLSIPSFLTHNHFKVGQQIGFRESATFHTAPATITDKLDDNSFRVEYLKYRRHTPEYRTSYTEATSDVDVSRLFPSSGKVCLVDLVDKSAIHRRLLVQSRYKAAYNVFNAVRLALISYSSAEQYGQYQSMSTFVAKHVYDALFAPQFRFSVHCMLNGDQHKELKMTNLCGIDSNRLWCKFYAPKPLMCCCCCCAINEFDFIFQCTNASYTDRHDYCLTCVGTVIALNKKLTHLLRGHTPLNSDGIFLIVDYTIGKSESLIKCGWHECGKTADRGKCFKLCSQCKMTYYCSRSCQKRAWNHQHRLICETMKQ